MANKLLGKFQKYFSCLKTRRRSSSSWRARPISFRTTWRERVATRLLGKFQKYFRCFNTRKRSKSSWTAWSLTFENRMESCAGRWPTDSWANSRNTSAASTRAKAPAVLEYTAHLLLELQGEKDGLLTLGQVSEVLQMLQHTQEVQIAWEAWPVSPEKRIGS